MNPENTMILYINSCVRKESRTQELANELLKTLGEASIERYLPEMDLRPLNEESLSKRTALIDSGDYSDSMFDLAKEFANADTIVIAAPYWDLSFPSYLKLYLENIYVTGIVSKFSPEGKPVGLCKATMLYYITTCGGSYDPDYSYQYIRKLAIDCFGIADTTLFDAENLDIEGNDVSMIMDYSKENIRLQSDLLKIRSGIDLF